MTRLQTRSRKAPARRATKTRGEDSSLRRLYSSPLKASRTGPLFSAFPYPTKISPEAAAIFIASHTRPGDTVFDGFAGSGTTGIAAMLCASPTPAMLADAERLQLKIKWGPRRAILHEIGTLGGFVANTLCNPPDPAEFRIEAERVLADVEKELTWIYHARDPYGAAGSIRYIIWSEIVLCPRCGKRNPLWDGCVRRGPAAIKSIYTCPDCLGKTPLSIIPRATRSRFDDVIGKDIEERRRQPVWAYGVTGKRQWSRPITQSDLATLARVNRYPLPSNVPLFQVPWGDLYRKGYHQGITHLHHFYTRRNLITFAALWKRTESSRFKDALQFWLLSYNASHATLMTRVVAKQGQRDLVVTSCQPGVLYVSGLPVEKNLFLGLRRKLKTIHAAFSMMHRHDPLVRVVTGSSLSTDLPDGSVDYAFTDPPFGGNIPYAEVNFINEAWLGHPTNPNEEVTISTSQGKDSAAYETLLTLAFAELRRVLKRQGRATVVFHSASSDVWNRLRGAYGAAGFGVETASILEKTQESFKQITAAGSVKGDPVLLLRPQGRLPKYQRAALLPLVERLLANARESASVIERTPQRLYSRFVSDCLARGEGVQLDARDFYRLIDFTSLNQNGRAPIN